MPARGRNTTLHSLWASLLCLQAARLAAAPPLAQPHGDQIFTYVQAEQLEYRAATDGADTLSWDVRGWIGGDYLGTHIRVSFFFERAEYHGQGHVDGEDHRPQSD